MTYAFMSALNATREKMGLTRVLHSYDINCQFWKNLWERIDCLPKALQRAALLEIDSKIPKLHLYGHQESCQATYALHWTKYAGMMDGEHVERLWAVLNFAAGSAKEQGPGARHDQLNDLCNHHNYRKILDLGQYRPVLRVRSRLISSIQATPFFERCSRRFRWLSLIVAISRGSRLVYDKTSPRKSSDGRKCWRHGMRTSRTRRKHRARTPIPTKVCSVLLRFLSLLTIRYFRKIPREVTPRSRDGGARRGVERGCAAGGYAVQFSTRRVITHGTTVRLHDQTYAGTSLMHVFRRKIVAEQRKEKARTTLQLAALEDQRRTLLGAFRRFREQQAFYMPGLKRFVDLEDPEDSGKHIEHIRLWIPSELAHSTKAQSHLPGLTDPNQRIRAAMCAACLEGLIELEERMQEAEAWDTLEELRSLLRIRGYIIHFKLRHLRGQNTSTIAQGKRSRVDAQIFAAKNRYRAAWLALCRLRAGKDDSWKLQLCELKDEDVRSVNERQMTSVEMEERRNVRQAGAAMQDREEGDGVDWDVPGSEGLALFGVLEHGEGRRKLSWIWLSAHLGPDGDPLMHEALRVEWAKSKARAQRWLEQVLYLEHCMRRTLISGEVRAAEWDLWAEWRAKDREERGETPVDAYLLEGLRAYASEHADLARRRAESFRVKWEDVRKIANKIIEEVNLEQQTGVEKLQFIFDELGLSDDMY